MIHWIASLHAWHFTCPVSLSLLHHINYINQATWRWGRITGTGGLASKYKFVSPSNEKISPASWFGLFIELGKNTFYCLNVHTFSTNVFWSLSFNWRLLTQYPYVKWKVIKWFFVFENDRNHWIRCLETAHQSLWQHISTSEKASMAT